MPESDAAERHLVAVVSDEPEHFRAIREHLGATFRILQAKTEDEIREVFENADVHAVLFDLDCVGDGAADGLEVLEEMRRLRDDLVLAAFTRATQRTLPLKAAQAGADEFFLVPLNFEELKIVLPRALEKRALELEGRRVIAQAEQKVSFCGLVGGSATMQKLYGSIEAVANTNASVLLRGESGVGKELIARAVVQCSERADKPYICLNCSALPENLIESELFGYEKGAFTGADTAKPGLIELAHGGTLFLDEITTLNPHLQSKLLRVLQERVSQRLGARHAQKIDFRLITATNEDLEDCVRKGRFREDLYFRINVVPIIVPPLRDRDGDIALLVDHFLQDLLHLGEEAAQDAEARRPRTTGRLQMAGQRARARERAPADRGHGEQPDGDAGALAAADAAIERGWAGVDAHSRRGRRFRRRTGANRAGVPQCSAAANRREEERGGIAVKSRPAADEIPLPEAQGPVKTVKNSPIGG